MKKLRLLLSVAFFGFQGQFVLSQSSNLSCLESRTDCLILEAQQIAELISETNRRDEAYYSILTAFIAQNSVDEALALVDKINNPRTQAESLAEVSLALAKLGRFRSAYGLAHSITDSRNKSSRITALEAVAIQQATFGLIADAFETVMAINNPFRRSEAQSAIAIAVARSGDLPRAIQAASKIATDYWFAPDQSSVKVASGLVSRSGEFDNYWFFETLVRISQLQARAGDIRDGLQTARSIPDVSARARAVFDIRRARGDWRCGRCDEDRKADRHRIWRFGANDCDFPRLRCCGEI